MKKTTPPKRDSGQPEPKRDPNASLAHLVGKLPYRPTSFTLRELRAAVKKVRAEHPELL